MKYTCNAFIIVISKHGYTAEDELSPYGHYQSALTTADTDGRSETLSSVDVTSMTLGRVTCDQSRTVVNTPPSLGHQGVNVLCLWLLIKFKTESRNCFHFPGTEGSEQNESDMCSLDWNSKEC